MKILHIDHSTARGGAEYALLRMLELPPPWTASLFVPRNNESNGVYSPLSVSVTTRLRSLGPAQTFGASKARGGILSIVGFASRALGQSLAIRFSHEFRNADVVHANTSRSAVYTALACFTSPKTKLVVHLRDLVDVDSLGSVGFVLFTKIALKRANGLIANSSASLAAARPYMRTGMPSAVIPSAAGIHERRSERPARLGLQTVGMVARLDPWKGQELLIRAFASVFRESDVRLVLAGSAPFGNEEFAEQLRLLASSLSIGDRVDFVGHVNDVEALVDSFDICVQSSVRPEPLGQNVLQYLAAGRATIATDQGGPVEWITSGENGLLFTMGDEASLADALRRLADDTNLRSRLAQAAAHTPGLATDREIADAHAKFFDTVSEMSGK